MFPGHLPRKMKRNYKSKISIYCSGMFFPYKNNIYFLMHKVVTKNQMVITKYILSVFFEYPKKRKENEQLLLHTTNFDMWGMYSWSEKLHSSTSSGHRFLQEVYD